MKYHGKHCNAIGFGHYHGNTKVFSECGEQKMQIPFKKYCSDTMVECQDASHSNIMVLICMVQVWYYNIQWYLLVFHFQQE